MYSEFDASLCTLSPQMPLCFFFCQLRKPASGKRVWPQVGGGRCWSLAAARSKRSSWLVRLSPWTAGTAGNKGARIYLCLVKGLSCRREGESWH